MSGVAGIPWRGEGELARQRHLSVGVMWMVHCAKEHSGHHGSCRRVEGVVVVIGDVVFYVFD